MGWLGDGPKRVSRALDVGCGKGAFTCRLASETAIRVLGIDSDANNVEASRARAIASGVTRQVAFEQGDFDELAWVSTLGGFDLVYALDSLQCSRDLTSICVQLTGQLHLGGVFLGTIWCFDDEAAPISREWGFERHYNLDSVAEAMTKTVASSFQISVNLEFITRCAGSLQAWQQNASTFESLIGRAAYNERLNLEKQTSHAAQSGSLQQIVVRASKS